MNSSQKYSPISALTLVLISIFIFSGLGFKISKKFAKNRNKRVLVNRIVHSSASSFSLPLTYLCELLGFHKQKSNFIDLRELDKYKKRLLLSPLIRDATLKTSGDELEIVYKLNYPKAKLFDFKHVLVDENCIVLPEDPFYTNLKLAKIYVGTNQRVEYSGSLNDPRLKIAMQFLLDYQDELESRGFFIDLLDVNRFYHSSIGKRQIVLMLTKCKKKYVLRLPTKDFVDAFERFYSIEKKLNKMENIVDLRVKDVAVFL